MFYPDDNERPVRDFGDGVDAAWASSVEDRYQNS